MKTLKLSTPAAIILSNVLDAMQDAEELGGVADNADYITLMAEISREAEARRLQCQYFTKEIA